MKSTQLFQRRAAGVTSVVLFGLVTMAACSEDRAVGPTPTTTAPTTASAMVRPALPTITTEYVDYGKNLVGGGAFQLKDTLGVTLLTIVDDAANDADKTPGKFKFPAPAGVYLLCETMPPPGYVFLAKPAQLCVKHTLPPNSSMHTGPYTVVPPYSAVWSTVAGFIPPNTPLWIGPSAFKITTSNGTFVKNVIDNGINDLHSMLGIYYVKLPAAGDYVICQEWAIPNYWMPKPRCHTVTAVFGQVAWGDYFVNPEKQVFMP